MQELSYQVERRQRKSMDEKIDFGDFKQWLNKNFAIETKKGWDSYKGESVRCSFCKKEIIGDVKALRKGLPIMCKRHFLIINYLNSAFNELEKGKETKKLS